MPAVVRELRPDPHRPSGVAIGEWETTKRMFVLASENPDGLVAVVYRGRTRTVKPEEVRISNEGHLLVDVVRYERDSEPAERTYRADRIERTSPADR